MAEQSQITYNLNSNGKTPLSLLTAEFSCFFGAKGEREREKREKKIILSPESFVVCNLRQKKASQQKSGRKAELNRFFGLFCGRKREKGREMEETFTGKKRKIEISAPQKELRGKLNVFPQNERWTKHLKKF